MKPKPWSGTTNPKYKDGRTSHPLWCTYWMMKARCENSRFPSYPRYGGRGITICDRWQDFAAFTADMGRRPPGFTLERVDNMKGYSPENCVWAAAHTQARNRRNNVNVILDGTTKTRAEWCRDRGVPQSTVRKRVARGLTYEEALR